MRALLISDTHRYLKNLLEVLERQVEYLETCYTTLTDSTQG